MLRRVGCAPGPPRLRAPVVRPVQAVRPVRRLRSDVVPSRTITPEVEKRLKLLGPPPLEPTTCCESGCEGCVWFRYLAELNDYMEKRAEIMGEPRVTPLKIRELDIDPSLKAFLAMEETFRDRK